MDLEARGSQDTQTNDNNGRKRNLSKQSNASSLSNPVRSSYTLSQGHPTEETAIAAHLLDEDMVEKLFETDFVKGLTEEEAADRFKIDGPNALPVKKDTTMLKLFRHNLFDWFPSMLWIGGILAICIHFVQFTSENLHKSNENLYLGVIILLVVNFSGFFGFYQEAKNAKVMRGFKDMIPQYANVIRNGEVKSILTDRLVVGDMVEMNAGEMVPADVRMIKVNNFRVDMSSITGEAEPQSRKVKCTHKNPLETKNLGFFSSQITDGNALGVVVATGERSVIGRIASLATGLEKEESPIAIEIKRFIKIVTAIAFLFGFIFFFMVTFIQNNILAGFYYMMGIIIANVPEGLLVTLTISLTLTALKLSKKNCLVKKLQSVETLGAMSCICSDKTGTLTENKMTVSHLTYDGKIFNAQQEMKDESFEIFATAACLCLRAEYTGNEPIEKREIKGDASEKAILRYMEAKNGASEVRKRNPKVAEIPFNSTNKYQISIHSMEENNSHRLVMKGAPEIIIKYCTKTLIEGKTIQMNDNERNEWIDLCTKLGQMGERVLGYCDLDLSTEKYPINFEFDTENINFPMEGFRFVGLISLIDPPRESVPYAIEKARSAGIKVIMVTGDHPITALAISKKVGIISEGNLTPYDRAYQLGVDPHVYTQNCDITSYKSVIITGDDLRTMSLDQLDHIIGTVEEITFARTSPQQKLMIVESCQRNGHVVGVTGDGVNDSPALKKADVGIAMNITGTDVSKNAADMILMDDNFASIILGVEEGRLIFENLKKCIAFTLTSNIPEMVPFVLYATVGIPLPLHALLIICIDVLTDLWPAISLVYEKAEADIMKKPPRNLDLEHLVTGNLITMAYFQVGIIQLIAGLTGYFTAMASYGFFPDRLVFTRGRWDSPSVNDFPDSYGQEWTYEERMSLEQLAQSTYYSTIVVVQIADVLICKTRRLSLFSQGMDNLSLNVGIALMLVMSCVILYVPVFNEYLMTKPVPAILWLTGIPFAFLILIFDECRKFIIRRRPRGWIFRELYY